MPVFNTNKIKPTETFEYIDIHPDDKFASNIKYPESKKTNKPYIEQILKVKYIV